MENYNIISNIGHGACGDVYLVRNTISNLLFAMKKIRLDESKKARTRNAVMREAKILASLKHTFIVTYWDSFFMDDDQTICILQDYCDGGSLDETIAKARMKSVNFPEDQILMWFFQITLAIEYIHSKHILHRDIKSQNILMTKIGNICKLGDFGISKNLSTTIDLTSTCIGTPVYLSPEACKDTPYNSKADALGCLLHEMCSLNQAFDAPNLINLFSKIIRVEYQPLPTCYSDAILDIVRSILVLSPDDRPSANDILKLKPMYSLLQQFSKDDDKVICYQIQQLMRSKDNDDEEIGVLSKILEEKDLDYEDDEFESSDDCSITSNNERSSSCSCSESECSEGSERDKSNNTSIEKQNLAEDEYSDDFETDEESNDEITKICNDNATCSLFSDLPHINQCNVGFEKEIQKTTLTSQYFEISSHY